MNSRRDDDHTQEVALPADTRPKRSAMTLHVIKGPRAGEVLTVDRGDAVLGRGDDADLRIEDPSLSRTHVRFERDGDTLTITDLDSLNGTLVEGTRLVGTRRLNSGDLLTLGNVLVRFAVQDPAELQVSRDLYEAAVRDRLTGLYNRGYFDDRIAAECAFVRRHQTSMAVLLIDLDHFKSINDAHGHEAGDGVLVQIADVVAGITRKGDRFFRLGGEEFALLVPGADPDALLAICEKLRTRVENGVDCRGTRVTISVGATPYLAGESASDWLARADAAMYGAKRRGRNRTVVAADGLAECPDAAPADVPGSGA